jgi:hypothetical protein
LGLVAAAFHQKVMVLQRPFCAAESKPNQAKPAS